MIAKHPRIVDKKLVDTIRGIGHCEKCGMGGSIALHVHHIKSRATFGDDVNDNLICLCWECHTKAHGGEISRDVLRRIAKRRKQYGR